MSCHKLADSALPPSPHDKQAHGLFPPSGNGSIYTTMDELLIRVRRGTDDEIAQARSDKDKICRYYHIEAWYNRAKEDKVINALDDVPKPDYTFFCAKICTISDIVVNIREQKHLL